MDFPHALRRAWHFPTPPLPACCGGFLLQFVCGDHLPVMAGWRISAPGPPKSPGMCHVLTLSECNTWYTVTWLAAVDRYLPHFPLWHSVDEHSGSKLSAWAFYVHHVPMSIKMLSRMVWKLSTVDHMRFDCCWLYTLSVPSGSRGMLHCKVDLKLLLVTPSTIQQSKNCFPKPLLCTKLNIILLPFASEHKIPPCKIAQKNQEAQGAPMFIKYQISPAQIAWLFFLLQTFPPFPNGRQFHLGMVSKAEFSASHLSPSQLAARAWDGRKAMPCLPLGWFLFTGFAVTRNHNFADTPWKINTKHVLIGVWKIIFLSKWVIGMFHVNLPGCKLK